MRRVALICIILLVFCGCYTVLRHPQVADVGPQDMRQDRCVSCHSDRDMEEIEWRLHHRYGYYHDRRWGDFYAYPWWYDDYWYWPGPSGGGSGSGGGAGGAPGTRLEQGQGLRDLRPPVPRAGQPPLPQKKGDGKKQPSGPRDSEPAQPPSPPKSGDGNSDPKSDAKDTTPKQERQGQGMQNDRPPRPRP